MPPNDGLAEEILLRVRAVLENQLRELDQATEKVDRFKAAGSGALDLGAEEQDKAVAEYRQSLGRLREQVGELKQSTDEYAESVDRQQQSYDRTIVGAAALVTAYKLIRQEQEALKETGEELVEQYPNLGAVVDSVGESFDRFRLGPISALRTSIDDVLERTTLYLGELEKQPAVLDQAAAAHQPLIEQFQALVNGLAEGGQALESEGQQLVLAEARLRGLAEENQAVALAIADATEQLVGRMEEAGVSVPANLRRIADQYSETADSVRELDEAQREQLATQELLQDEYRRTTQELEDFQAAVDSALEGVGADVGQLDEQLNVLLTAFQGLLEQGPQTATVLGKMRDEVASLVEQFQVAGAEVPEDLQTLFTRLEAIAPPTKEAEEAARKHAEALEKEAAAARRAARDLDSVREAEEGLARTGLFGTTPADVEQLSQTVEQLTRRVQQLREQQNAEGILSAEDLTALLQAEDDLQRAEADLARARQDLGEATDSLADSNRDATEATNDFVTATEIHGRAVDNLTGQVTSLDDRTRRLANEYRVLKAAQEDALSDAERQREELRLVGEQADQTADKIRELGTVSENTFGQMIQLTATLSERLREVIDLCEELKQCEQGIGAK